MIKFLKKLFGFKQAPEEIEEPKIISYTSRTLSPRNSIRNYNPVSPTDAFSSSMFMSNDDYTTSHYSSSNSSHSDYSHGGGDFSGGGSSGGWDSDSGSSSDSSSSSFD